MHWSSICRGAAAPCVLALLALAPGSAAAAPDQEDAGRALKRAAKALAKERSYRVDVSVEGGKARGADHRLTERTVSATYQAEVLGKVCRVQRPAAIRMRFDSLKGAVQDGGRWMAMLATDQGRLVARLFEAPEKHLAQAVRFKRTARWVEVEAAAGSSPGAVFASRAEDDEREGTQEREGPSSSGRDDAEGPLSRHIRVVGSAETAVEQFITITNSGCFSEG